MVLSEVEVGFGGGFGGKRRGDIGVGEKRQDV